MVKAPIASPEAQRFIKSFNFTVINYILSNSP